MAGLSRLITVFLLLYGISFGILYAQVPVKKSENKVIIEGKIYYLHVVKPGQTLYSITRAYEVSEKDIAIENPGVYSGLQVGQVLKIPADVPRVKKEEESIDTSKYIRHSLKTGETLYSLSRKYNVPVEEIENANPDVDLRDLPVGMVILIPKLRTIYSQEDFILHTVRRKETVYRLARKYNVSEEDIIKYNPELKWGELKTGQVIRIPKEEFLAAMETEEITDLERTDTLDIDWGKEEEIDETWMMDSLGLEEMSVDDYYKDLKDFNTDRLNVAILIPFNYRIIPKDIEEEKEEEKTKKEKKEEEEEENLPRSINFLEFFEGSLLALDSLKKEGIDLNVRYFDTYRSPSRIREILNADFFRDVDLIIGPFFAYNVELVSEFSRKNRVPLISPFYDGEDLTKRNPYLFQINPSYKTEYSRAAEILSRDYDKNFIFIYEQDSPKYHEIEFFKSSLLKDLDRFIHTENVVLKEISYENPAKEDLAKDFSHALTKDRRNIVIIPEQDQAFVSTVITQLYFQLKDYDIEVFGLPHFHEFENDYKYFHELSLSYLSPFHYDYDDEQIIKFIQKFSTHFKAPPRLATRKGCSYAFIGYDLTYYFIRNMAQWDNRFVSHLNAGVIDNLLPSFYFHRDSRYGGFENQTLKMVSFTKDYDVDSWDTELELKPELPDRIRRFWFERDE